MLNGPQSHGSQKTLCCIHVGTEFRVPVGVIHGRKKVHILGSSKDFFENGKWFPSKSVSSFGQLVLTEERGSGPPLMLSAAAGDTTNFQGPNKAGRGRKESLLLTEAAQRRVACQGPVAGPCQAPGVWCQQANLLHIAVQCGKGC